MANETTTPNNPTNVLRKFAVHFRTGERICVTGYSISDGLIKSGYVPEDCRVNFYSEIRGV